MTNSTDPIIPRAQARTDYLGNIHKTTLWRWEKTGKLPPPIRLSSRVIGWRKSTLEAFIAQHQAGEA